MLYLIFNESYATSSGEALQRVDLLSGAIRLARAAHELLPDHGEVSGLLSADAAHRRALRRAIGSAEDTDWPQIVALYTVLMRMADNPLVALNHVVAVAMARGPADGLALLEKLDRDPGTKDHYRLDAVRAHLLGRPSATTCS